MDKNNRGKKELPPETDHPVGSVGLDQPQSHISNIINNSHYDDGTRNYDESSSSKSDNDSEDSF